VSKELPGQTIYQRGDYRIHHIRPGGLPPQGLDALYAWLFQRMQAERTLLRVFPTCYGSYVRWVLIMRPMQLLIIERADRPEVLGFVYLCPLMGDTQAGLWEAGLCFFRSAWGTNDVLASCIECRDWIFEHPEVRCLVGVVRQTNRLSAALCRKLGFEFTGYIPSYFGDEDGQLWCMTAKRWQEVCGRKVTPGRDQEARPVAAVDAK
jgi:hypothetical protein